MDISPSTALIVACVVFAFVAFMHLLRLFYKTQIVVGKKQIPIWASSIGFVIALLLSIWMLLASSQASAASLNQGASMFTLKSSAFKEGETIPAKYTCVGEDVSPPLSWEGTPDKTQTLVLIVDDPDASAGTWDHWILFNIPSTTQQFTENLKTLPDGAQYGKNDWGKLAYSGPCPPSGEHRYFFKLYALDASLNLPNDAKKSQIEAAMKGHVLATAELMGKFKK